MDFTLKYYKKLLESLLSAGFHFLTFEAYCKEKPVSKFVILRHDVDRKPERSLVLARIEAAMGVTATYYFRIVPESNQPEIIKAIAGLGHEIAYHYEDLSRAGGDYKKAYTDYQENLNYFREFYPVQTISMHGSPREKTDNRDLWKHYDYRQFGIIGEPYFDFIGENVNNPGGSRFYFTDTGGMWDGDKYNVRDKAMSSSSGKKVSVHSTDDLIRFLTTGKNTKEVMLNTHPQRWTDHKAEWLLEHTTQKAKNLIKMIIISKIRVIRKNS